MRICSNWAFVPMTMRECSTMIQTGEPGDKTAADAIVIGAMRAGTTALYRVFLESGLVAVPECKETDFYLSKENFLTRSVGFGHACQHLIMLMFQLRRDQSSNEKSSEIVKIKHCKKRAEK